MTSKSTFSPEIIYEDNDVLVLNKPSGLIVHSDGKTPKDSGAAYGAGFKPTLVDWIIAKYPELKNVGEPWVAGDGRKIPRPGIVHRLDRDTSGAIIVAKTQATFEYLKTQFQNRAIEKKYLAFVYGTLPQKNGTIDFPIGKSKKDFRLRSAERGARGTLREARTEYKVLREGGGVSYVELIPKTGRTHQIRAHLKALHHPVVGDALYAPKRELLLGFKRLALHAHSLSLLMQNGMRMTFEAPLPEDFESALSLMPLS